MKLTKLNDLLEDDKTTKGKWELTPNHTLQYKSKDLDEEIKLSGTLIAAEANALVFAVTERQKDQKIVTCIHKLTGTWRANPQNQLVFEVEKESGKKDTLTFKAGWDVNDRHEIVYTYDQVNLKTKRKEARELVLKGAWDISEKNRLTYSVGGDASSVFRFRGTFQTKSILAKKGEIRYQLGVEVAGKPKTQTVTLFGKWILSRDLNLSFEMATGDKSKKTILFGGTYSVSDSADVTVNLKSQEGKPLGVELILTKGIFNGDGQTFIRLQRSIGDSRMEAGMKFKS